MALESGENLGIEEERSGFVKPERIRRAAFADAAILHAFLQLQEGRFEEKRLAWQIRRAIDTLTKDPFAGVAVPRRLWPKEYVRKFSIDNLRKYDLPDGWRLLYTIHGSEIEIVSVILEWCSHKEYEKRFGYNVG